MIVRHNRLAAFAAALTFALPSAVFAHPDGSAQREIDHLLEFVAGSSCTFERNGADYPAQKAGEHLTAKFRYAASRITTAEDFIRDLASRSSVSGDSYRVKCGKVDMPAGVWLTEELQRYREARVRTARTEK
jgi:hypothetical protein